MILILKNLRFAWLPAAALLGISLLSGCHFNTVMQNQSEDKADAERITSRFYDIQRSGNLGMLDSLYSQGFKDASPSEKRKAYMQGVNQKLGLMKTIALTNWQSRVTSGTDAGARYQLVYDVTREKHTSTETFALIKEGDSVRIQAYNVNSDALLMPDSAAVDGNSASQ